MKQRIDSDLGAAIKKSCRGLLVDTCCCNDQPVCIAGGANIADFGVLHICIAELARSIIASGERARKKNKKMLSGIDSYLAIRYSVFYEYQVF